MTEWEDPDGPGSIEGVADRVISDVRRRRIRRGTLLGAGGLAVVAAVAVPLIAGVGDSGPAVADATHRPAPTSAGITPSLRAQIYAAALAGGPHPQTLHTRIYVRNRICSAVPAHPATRCDNRPISAEVQRDVKRLLGDNVQFATHTPDPHRLGDPTVVLFGALRVRGDHATLGMEVLCGPLCGEGKTLVLDRDNGQWQVTGTTGPEWIS